ncbi:MAG: 4-hydroxythreonine-4-phosphate dehydrogenase PdxA [Flammeovirgaceae bacterium]|nr:4-hydroxythreonine-4-phosphate dehydrogenase PdxA [Flammeovirgaceae bacterium]
MNKPRIGISLGDLNGIGPEVVIKALADSRVTNLFTPVIYGSSRVLSFYKKIVNLEEFNYSQVKTKGQFAAKSINVVNCWEDQIEIIPGKASTDSGRAAWLALKTATQELKEGLLDALVTAPIDKHTIHSNDFPYKGHTEFLTEFFGVKDSLMLMVSETLRVGLVTGHIPIKDVAAQITKEKVETKLRLLEQSLKQDFGISKPKMAVLGLNPHAGDNGLIGTEDDQIIKPVVQDFKNKGKLVFGPLPADGFFATSQHGRFDGILAMYHDQGLVPFKSLAFDTGVNFTAGLPVVRTSPDHGTAYNLAGKNQAREQSMLKALFTAVDIVTSRLPQLTEK